MDREKIFAIADQFLEARRIHQQIGAPVVASEREAHEIQIEISRRAGGIGGWKCGYPPGCDGVRFSPVLRSAIHQSGRTFDANAFHMIGIEAEVAFRIGRTFTPGPRPQREEIESAMGEAFPAIEVVDARIRDFRSASGLSLLADNLLSGALLLGKPLPDWRAMELSRPGFEILINGEVKGPAGTNRTPDIVEMIGDIVKLCGDLGMEIPADTIITTGTSTGLIFATQGDYVELRCGSDILVDAWF